MTISWTLAALMYRSTVDSRRSVIRCPTDQRMDAVLCVCVVRRQVVATDLAHGTAPAPKGQNS